MSETSLTYGLNAGGFVRMRMPEVRRAIFNDLTSRTGLVFDESPDSFTGQFVAIFAEREAALWELAERAYLSAYPITSQGIPLDLAVSYSGVRRLQPVRSRAVAYLVGTSGTQVPAGLVVQASVASDAADVPPRFLLQTNVSITKTAVVGASLTVPATVTAGTSYWIEAAGVRYTVVATAGQTSVQIAAALDAQLGNLASATNSVLTIFDPVPFVIDWSNTLNINNITCVGTLVSEEFGPIPAAEKTITKIITPIAGLSAVYNQYAAVPGQTLETDDKLRSRYSLGVYRLGAGTVPSIYANLMQDVPGILSLRVFENTALTADADGRPGKSIEIIADGGDTDAIIQKIYAIKPSGITAFGNTSGFVKSPDGYNNPIAFSRPEIRWIWLRISFATNAEESIPGDIAGRIIAAVLAEGARMSPGQDVLLQRLQSAPFSATTGLARVTITAAATGPNAAQPTTYAATDISMNPRQKAALDISRIVIV